MRLARVLALALIGTSCGATLSLAQALRHYDIDDLHKLLVIADVRKAGEVERTLERAGGVIVAGMVGDVAALPEAQFHVWLRPANDAELIARFVVPVLFKKGDAIALHCPAPWRSYSLVIGICKPA